jgi:uncharacterized repeat protein (TIGR01451 family)/LPXTG-motif cell wall-anchored protein
LGQSSKDTLSDGTATFDNILPDNYTLGEIIKNGWEQTNIICGGQEGYNSENKTFDLTVNPGNVINCSILNHNKTPILTISKVNDASGNKAPGDTVGFTITVAADETGGPADNVTVTDLLPKGFVYNAGSYQALLNGVLNSSITEPTYHSPGVWTLGHMNLGDIYTLKYTAKIDGGQPTGTYYDNAWGQGNPVGGSDVILARAINPGDLDPALDPSEFVGTEVSIVNGSQGGPTFSTTTTQSVLGASTGPELPSTGESTLWVIMASLLSILGLGSLALGVKLRRKYA